MVVFVPPSIIYIYGAGGIMFSGCPSACACLPGQRHSPAGLLLTPSFGMSFAIEDSYLVLDGVGLGLPDLPYFTGDPVFQTLSSASRGGEAAGKNKSPVFC